jgi:hypothetical protein
MRLVPFRKRESWEVYYVEGRPQFKLNCMARNRRHPFVFNGVNMTAVKRRDGHLDFDSKVPQEVRGGFG